MVDLRDRLWAALSGFGTWLFMYYAITVTQLFEINAIFWPRFILFGLLVVGVCAARGLPFTAYMVAHAFGYAAAGALFIWFFWPYLPLSEFLPAPEARW